MKRLAVKIIMLAAPVALFMGTITLLSDPGQIFFDLSPQISDLMISGKNAWMAAAPSSFGRLQKHIVARRVISNLPPLDTVVWGSSRSSEINSSHFPGRTFFNSVVPGGNVLDYIALFGLFKHNNQLPGTVIINIDAWSFYARHAVTVENARFYTLDPESDLTVDSGLEDELIRGLSDLQIPFDKSFIMGHTRLLEQLPQYRELLSPSYFQLSLRGLAKSGVIATAERGTDHGFIIRSDGSYSLQQTRDVNDDAVAAKARLFANTVKGSFFCSSCFQSRYMNFLEILLKGLIREKVDVVIFLAPVHPISYDILAQHEKNTMEPYLRTVCADLGIPVIGSFNPHRYGLGMKDKSFLDQYHPSSTAVDLIMAAHRGDMESIWKTGKLKN